MRITADVGMNPDLLGCGGDYSGKHPGPMSPLEHLAAQEAGLDAKNAAGDIDPQKYEDPEQEVELGHGELWAEVRRRVAGEVVFLPTDFAFSSRRHQRRAEFMPRQTR
jgi:hypothetical protein